MPHADLLVLDFSETGRIESARRGAREAVINVEPIAVGDDVGSAAPSALHTGAVKTHTYNESDGDVKWPRRDAVTETEDETGRFRQRRRTRAAIVAAAAQLLAVGHTPSVTDVAEAAGVSRRTVYLYFPSLEQLLLDATLGMLSQAAVGEASMRRTPAVTQPNASRPWFAPWARCRRRRWCLDGRSFALTVAPADGGDATSPRRGYRRVAWIERALEPLRPQLDPPAFERLVSRWPWLWDGRRSSCCRICGG